MTFIITFILFALCILLMASGLFFLKKPLKKGCSLGVDCECEKSNKESRFKKCNNYKD